MYGENLGTGTLKKMLARIAAAIERGEIYLGEIVVEKGKPPKEKDIPAMYMRKLVPELCEQNAKLRELLQDLYHCSRQVGCDHCGDNYRRECSVLSCMSGLGIEVDG